MTSLQDCSWIQTKAGANIQSIEPPPIIIGAGDGVGPCHPGGNAPGAIAPGINAPVTGGAKAAKLDGCTGRGADLPHPFWKLLCAFIPESILSLIMASARSRASLSL